MTNQPVLLLAFSLAVATASSSAAPVGTAFTYSGRLTDSGLPATGLLPMVFALYDVASGGNTVAPTIPFNVPVTNGLFTVDLEFGPNAFVGEARWVQITVNGSPLAPRQRLAPTPQAIFASTAAGVTGGAITSAMLAPNAVNSPNLAVAAVTAPKIADGQVVKSLNGFNDSVALSAGVNIAITPSGNGLQISAPGGVNGWGLAGNSAQAGSFLGTTNDQPLEMRVKNLTALRIVPGTDQLNLIGGPNIVGGANVNSVASDLQGATIAGGGLISLSGTAYPNRILSNSSYATIGGGLGNTISTNAAESTIAGGNQNVIHSNAFRSVIGGGYRNHVGTNCNTSTISGGVDNSAGSNAAFVGGGTGNRANGSSSTVAGGYDNTAAGAIGFVGGGARNRASASGAAVVGGDGNRASGDYSTVAGGYLNVASGPSVSIGGGTANAATADSATVPGGSDNSAQGRHSFAAGRGARALHDGSFVWADRQGVGAIPTPFESTAPNQFRVRAAGGANFEGDLNVSGAVSAQNFSLDDRDLRLRGIGDSNHGLGWYGSGKTFSNLRPNDPDGPVLYGWNGGMLGTTKNGNDYLLRWDTGGVVIRARQYFTVLGSSSPGELNFFNSPSSHIFASSGASLTSGGVWQNASDRNRKASFESVNLQMVLKKVAALPVLSWRYTNEAADIRHIGPTAQDFKAAFGLGTEDKSIGTVDADGVALAAIQGLYQIVQEQQTTSATREAEILALKEKVAGLEKELTTQQQTLARWESRFAAMEQALARLPVSKAVNVSATSQAEAAIK